ncbi:hypothetical protein BC938DRAFT_472402 [Jimgerdemannia flammicorona]|uniref:Uncharacterized protein n=1 Tax=Jimgerdemannia flammicorona TaxID=994334 RepID=A0A433Q679_9FUNG|nr:hypothetical protein BC938DRAFT_472402 [Jimgerdemannia flammicorona]
MDKTSIIEEILSAVRHTASTQRLKSEWDHMCGESGLPTPGTRLATPLTRPSTHVSQIDWTQPWLLALLGFHVFCFVGVLLIRKHPEALQMSLFLLGDSPHPACHGDFHHLSYTYYEFPIHHLHYPYSWPRLPLAAPERPSLAALAHFCLGQLFRRERPLCLDRLLIPAALQCVSGAGLHPPRDSWVARAVQASAVQAGASE